MTNIKSEFENFLTKFLNLTTFDANRDDVFTVIDILIEDIYPFSLDLSDSMNNTMQHNSMQMPEYILHNMRESAFFVSDDLIRFKTEADLMEFKLKFS